MLDRSQIGFFKQAQIESINDEIRTYQTRINEVVMAIPYESSLSPMLGSVNICLLTQKSLHSFELTQKVSTTKEIRQKVESRKEQLLTDSNKKL